METSKADVHTNQIRDHTLDIYEKTRHADVISTASTGTAFTATLTAMPKQIRLIRIPSFPY